MPTPSDDTHQLSSAGLGLDRLTHATCPPESGRVEEWRTYDGSRVNQTVSSTRETPQPTEPLLAEHEIAGQAENAVGHDAPMNMDDTDQDQTITDGSSPMSTTTDAREAERQSPAPRHPSQALVFPSYPTSYEFSNIRVSLISCQASYRIWKLTSWYSNVQAIPRPSSEPVANSKALSNLTDRCIGWKSISNMLI